MYHGWKVVVCAFLIAVFGWGFGFYGIGVFLAELVERHGWATGSVSSAVTVLYLAGAVLIAFIGNAFERFGPRRVVLAACRRWGGCHRADLDHAAVAALRRVSADGRGVGGHERSRPQRHRRPWFERRRGLAISSRSTGRPSAGSCWSRRSCS